MSEVRRMLLVTFKNLVCGEVDLAVFSSLC